MFTSDERDYLEDIVSAAREAQEHVGASSKDEFLRNRKDQDSVNYKFIVMGEAARQLADLEIDFHARHPSVPWSKMIGMRNIVAHRYGRVDPEIVWNSLKTTVPALLEYLEPLLRGPGNDDMGGPGGDGPGGGGTGATKPASPSERPETGRAAPRPTSAAPPSKKPASSKKRDGWER